MWPPMNLSYFDAFEFRMRVVGSFGSCGQGLIGATAGQPHMGRQRGL